MRKTDRTNTRIHPGVVAATCGKMFLTSVGLLIGGMFLGPLGVFLALVAGAGLGAYWAGRSVSSYDFLLATVVLNALFLIIFFGIYIATGGGELDIFVPISCLFTFGSAYCGRYIVRHQAKKSPATFKR